jgi:hypothetical protein
MSTKMYSVLQFDHNFERVCGQKNGDLLEMQCYEYFFQPEETLDFSVKATIFLPVRQKYLQNPNMATGRSLIQLYMYILISKLPTPTCT